MENQTRDVFMEEFPPQFASTQRSLTSASPGVQLSPAATSQRIRAGIFPAAIDASRLDEAPFKARHGLMGCKALELESLTQTLLRLPENQVYTINRPLNAGDHFEENVRRARGSKALASTLHNLMDSNSLIVVNSPEVDPSFQPIYQEILASISELAAFRDPRRPVLMPTLYLFIASPNSVTPFHLDRYSTFLFQFRGSKKVAVASPWDSQVISDPDREAYVSYADTTLPWSDERERRMTHFNFHPGEALHIPFVSGHYVKNGPDDISISMSVIFNTQRTMMWRQALNFNHRARRLLRPLNITPSPVGQNALRDAGKARLWQAWLSARARANF
ncbi:cupin-like domain-containing protein [Marinobacter sp. chi1]|uniref:Cupin-like domain-containing protein n=1 Tax=Marinobacter suaedae TaxID=3057675 RepID=A0ABT8W3K5_9GAMM|nr:cupin-like domain-containing protein [Marinobacter sp. chi1]MDO3722814.1 cupin-like domain-containing protein [Marinobacter sp. chi1]